MPNYYTPEEQSSLIGSYDTLLDPTYKKRKQTLAETLAGTGMNNGAPASYGFGEIEAQRAADVGNYAQKLGEQGLQYGFQSGESQKQRDFQGSQAASQRGWQSGENALDRTENARQFDKNFDENVRQFGMNYALQQAESKMNQAKVMMDTTGKQWTLDPETGEWKAGTDLTYGAQTAKDATDFSKFGSLASLISSGALTPEQAKAYLGSGTLADLVGTVQTPGQVADTSRQTDPMDKIAVGQGFTNSGSAGMTFYNNVLAAAPLGEWNDRASDYDNHQFIQNNWTQKVAEASGMDYETLQAVAKKARDESEGQDNRVRGNLMKSAVLAAVKANIEAGMAK